MAKDHYLPAGFIGRFSSDTAGAYRKRRLWVYNWKASKTLNTAAGAIGYKHGLYNLHGGKTIDKWGYEGPLNRVLDDLVQGKEITLDDWVRIAVPFVTGLFIRGKEFNERYESLPLIKVAAGRLTPDNTNGSRILRLQRQLAPVMAARWVVLHPVGLGATPFISNDLGLVGTLNAVTNAVGWAIPLDPKTLLGIFPQKMRAIGRFDSGVWRANIEHVSPPAALLQGMNEQIARTSQEFIFGASKADVDAYKQDTGVEAVDQMPFVMEYAWAKTLSYRELAAHAEDWWRVASIANLNLSPDQALNHHFGLKDLDIENKWVPPMVFLSINTTEFPSGVGFHGDDMLLNLNLLDDFDSHILHKPGSTAEESLPQL